MLVGTTMVTGTPVEAWIECEYVENGESVLVDNEWHVGGIYSLDHSYTKALNNPSVMISISKIELNS